MERGGGGMRAGGGGRCGKRRRRAAVATVCVFFFFLCTFVWPRLRRATRSACGAWRACGGPASHARAGQDVWYSGRTVMPTPTIRTDLQSNEVHSLCQPSTFGAPALPAPITWTLRHRRPAVPHAAGMLPTPLPHGNRRGSAPHTRAARRLQQRIHAANGRTPGPGDASPPRWPRARGAPARRHAPTSDPRPRALPSLCPLPAEAAAAVARPRPPAVAASPPPPPRGRLPGGGAPTRRPRCHAVPRHAAAGRWWRAAAWWGGWRARGEDGGASRGGPPRRAAAPQPRFAYRCGGGPGHAAGGHSKGASPSRASASRLLPPSLPPLTFQAPSVPLTVSLLPRPPFLPAALGRGRTRTPPCRPPPSPLTSWPPPPRRAARAAASPRGRHPSCDCPWWMAGRRRRRG